MQDFKETIREFIADIVDMDPVGFDSNDVVYTLTESNNATGSYTYNSYEAKSQLLNWDEEDPHLLENYVRWGKNSGMDLASKYFENIEEFQVLLIIDTLVLYLGESSVFSSYCNSYGELQSCDVEQLVEELIEELDECDVPFSSLF